ncbi:MAG: transposase [bacterium]|nr:transposase [bacterium]
MVCHPFLSAECQQEFGQPSNIQRHWDSATNCSEHPNPDSQSYVLRSSSTASRYRRIGRNLYLEKSLARKANQNEVGGTNKMAVVSAVERGGKVLAKPAKENKLNFKILSGFVRETVDTGRAELLTNEYKGYGGMTVVLPHSEINHNLAYSFMNVHTNTIEGFGYLLKRAWFGQHHHYSRKKAHLYFGEACYKYNNRKNGNTFFDIIRNLLSGSK